MKKACYKCQLTKDTVLFHKQSASADGLMSYCKDCCREARKRYDQGYREANINMQKVTEGLFKCYKCKQTKSATEFAMDRTKKSRVSTTCSSCMKPIGVKFRAKNPELVRQHNAQYYIDNSEKIKKDNRQYYENNKQAMNAYARKREMERLKTDQVFKLKRYLRDNILKALRRTNTRKNTKTQVLLGCSIFEFKQYIANRFVEAMTWQNYGKWHLDHIKPSSSFDLTDTEEQKQCFHYTNYQPLWAIDNIIKGSLYKGKRHRLGKAI